MCLAGVLLMTSVQAQTVTPTWSVSFDTKEDLNGFTIIDANGDAHVYENILRGGWSWLSHEEVSGAACYYYDANHDADDWLITPGINLAANREYTVSFDANAANIFPEYFEVCMGDAATAEAQTTLLIPSTKVFRGEFEPFSATFSVQTDGVYYVGIHAISPKGSYILDIKNLTVEAGLLPAAPAAVTDFLVTADQTGLRKTHLSFVLPTTCNDGSKLDAISRVTLSRGETLLAEYTDVHPGEQLTADDTQPKDGLYTYTVIVYNEAGDGAQAKQTVWVGYDAPDVPINPHVIDKLTSIDLVWEQSLGQHGGPIKKSDMKYYIYSMDEDGNMSTRLATVEKGKTTYNIKMNTREGEQRLLTYILVACNSKGLSQKVETKGFLLGKPLASPFAEDFTDSQIENYWWVSGEGTGYLNQYAGFFVAASSNDAKPGSLMYEGFFDDDLITLHSAKVELSALSQPWLTFSHKAMPGTGVELSVKVCKPDATADTVFVTDYRSANCADWTRQLIDLSTYLDYSYLTVEFQFRNFSNELATMTYLDNIHIGACPDYDLAATLDVPATLDAGAELSRTLTVTNWGCLPVSQYSIVSNVTSADGLLHSRQELITQPLLPRQSRRFTDVCPTARDAQGQLTVTASVQLAEEMADAQPANNSAEAIAQILPNNLPTVSDLLGWTSEARGEVTLQWQAPEHPSRPCTESFEDYDPWLTTQAGAWQMLDQDFGLSEEIFQGYHTGLEDQSFAFTTFNLSLLNPGFVDTNKEFTARTGQQCMMALFGHDGFYNYRNQDNWLISPELSGAAQRLVFYAANYDMNSPETFEVMVSTTDDDPMSFIRIGGERRVYDGTWHVFTAQLPAGSRYFAIHQNTVADNAYLLKLDDFSFDCALHIDHYDVCLDGQRVATVPADACTITLPVAAAVSPSDYTVSVIYAEGFESLPVAATVTDAIQAVSADASTDTVCYDLLGRRHNHPVAGRMYLIGKRH